MWIILAGFNGNRATLHELPERDAAAKYVEFMGGADAVLERREVPFDAGDYRWVAQVVNHVVFADPSNKAPPSPYWSHVIFWHLADIDACAEHVRFEE